MCLAVPLSAWSSGFCRISLGELICAVQTHATWARSFTNTATHFLPVNLPDLVTSETLFPQDAQEFPVWFFLVGLLSVTILQMNMSGPELCPLSLVTAYICNVNENLSFRF